jgi:uncharacterized protein
MNDAAFVIRDATVHDQAAILALNLASEHLLSPLDAPRLAHLDRESTYHRVVLALREAAEYDSPNYRWFAARFERFLYVDRIAVAAAWQGRQLGRALYENLFAYARASGVQELACEFYVVPLNEASLRFHAAFGFHEVGRQWVAGGSKQVSLQVAAS